jgi:hypothetical protein
MLKGLIQAANKKGMKLAPFIGIGCPGIIGKDGSIERGAQNLPGNWEGSKFNLPVSLLYLIPKIGDEEASIVMHNDAVVQGLSLRSAPALAMPAARIASKSTNSAEFCSLFRVLKPRADTQQKETPPR